MTRCPPAPVLAGGDAGGESAGVKRRVVAGGLIAGRAGLGLAPYPVPGEKGNRVPRGTEARRQYRLRPARGVSAQRLVSKTKDLTGNGRSAPSQVVAPPLPGPT